MNLPTTTVALPECEKSALPVVAAPDFNTDEVIIHAASLLQQGKHPFAAALLAFADDRSINLLPAAYVETQGAVGWTGRVNGKVCVLGKKDLMAEAYIDIRPLDSESRRLRESGHEVYFLSIGDHLAGILGMPVLSPA